jgi:hypothetical protein
MLLFTSISLSKCCIFRYISWTIFIPSWWNRRGLKHPPRLAKFHRKFEAMADHSGRAGIAKDMWSIKYVNVSVGPEKGLFRNEFAAALSLGRPPCSAAWPQWKPLSWSSFCRCSRASAHGVGWRYEACWDSLFFNAGWSSLTRRRSWCCSVHWIPSWSWSWS